MSDDAATTTAQTGNDAGNGDTAAGAGSTPSGSSTIDSFPAEAQDYIRRLRAESAEKRNEAKAAKDKLKNLEDAGKSEEERRQQALTTAQSEAEKTAHKLLCFEVAAEKDLPLKMAARLQGETKEELERDADELKTELGISADGQAPGGFDGGARRSVNRPQGAPKTMNGLIGAAFHG